MPTSQPVYYTGALIGAATLGTTDTGLGPSAPTNKVTVVASAAGAQAVYQIRFMQKATTSSVSYVNLFLYDGSSYWLFDAFAVPVFAFSAGSAEAPPIDKYYRNLDIPAGWSLVATTATTASVGAVLAFGGS